MRAEAPMAVTAAPKVPRPRHTKKIHARKKPTSYTYSKLVIGHDTFAVRMKLEEHLGSIMSGSGKSLVTSAQNRHEIWGINIPIFYSVVFKSIISAFCA